MMQARKTAYETETRHLTPSVPLPLPEVHFLSVQMTSTELLITYVVLVTLKIFFGQSFIMVHTYARRRMTLFHITRAYYHQSRSKADLF